MPEIADEVDERADTETRVDEDRESDGGEKRKGFKSEKYNPHLDYKDMQRLRAAMRASRRKLRDFRENRLAAIKEFVGKHYTSDGGTDEKVPLPLLEQAISIYTYQLAARSPKAMISTVHPELKPSAENLRLAVDYLLEHRLHIEDRLQSIAQEALFQIGIVKVGLCDGGTAQVDGYNFRIGRIFVDLVSLDDWVHDMNAHDWDQAEYRGNRYRVRLEDVKKNEAFDPEARRRLKPMQPGEDKGMGDDGLERDSDISSGGSHLEDDEFKRHCELFDVFLPIEGLVVTMDADLNSTAPPLLVREWDGPDAGPYLMLGFTKVPGNSMPLPVAAVLTDLHDLSNRLFRKLARQAERQKTLSVVQRGADKDGSRIIEANDGEMVAVDNPNATREVSYGGVDPRNLAFTLQTRDYFSYFGGNLDLLGGLSPQSDTASQDQMLGAAASKRVQFMVDRFMSFVRKLVQVIAQYLWEDPLVELPLSRRIPGVEGLEIPVFWSQESKEGEFFNYNIDVEPYSTAYESPQMKLQKTIMLMREAILPLMPILMQQGITINAERLVRMIRDYGNLPAFEDLFIFASPPPQSSPVGQPTGKAANTNRTYTRVNRPGATTAGKDQALIATLLGSANRQERASIGRING